MSDHECNYWITPGGTLECACGKSKHPVETDAAPAAETSSK